MLKQSLINLEYGMPTTAEAKIRLEQQLGLCKTTGTKVLKVIHGYGSSGKGGAIKRAVIRMMKEKEEQGLIRIYMTGEDFTPLTEKGRQAIMLYPDLRKDPDYARCNDGISIIILK